MVVSGFKVTGRAVCDIELVVFGKDRRRQEAGWSLFGVTLDPPPMEPVVSLTNHGIALLFNVLSLR